MLGGRHILYTDDRGDMSEDFAGEEVIATPRRRAPFVVGKDPVSRMEWSPAKRRDIRSRAVLILKRAGFHNDEIAVAVALTDRQVRNKLRAARTVAEAHARV